MKKIFLGVFALLMLTMSFTNEPKFTVFMIGDSTMANKDTTGGKQERGWGMVLQQYFDSHVLVDNHAVNGRSTKSFINEGRWDKVLAKIKPGDYVFIQFGHNDEKPQPRSDSIHAGSLEILPVRSAQVAITFERPATGAIRFNTPEV